MKRSKSAVVCVLLVAGCSMFGARADQHNEQEWKNLKLWYGEPARKWTEALPVGNGRLGAMVFGTVETERLQLNEDTLWAGHPLDRDRVGAHKYLPEARRLIFEGKYVEAQRIMQRQFMG
ncbi:MAG: glycoside hydrolase N-terminal domain-containing protein, partial [Planctomycetota bacterium]